MDLRQGILTLFDKRHLPYHPLPSFVTGNRVFSSKARTKPRSYFCPPLEAPQQFFHEVVADSFLFLLLSFS